jgi:hypothetical protein
MRDYIIIIKQEGEANLSYYATAQNMVDAFAQTLEHFPAVVCEHEAKGGSISIDILTLGDERERYINGKG